MKRTLTFRYIGMLILSTLLLLGLSFLLLTLLENSNSMSDSPGAFASNFTYEILVDDADEIRLSEKGQKELLAKDAWIQFLSEEGHVTASFNTPSYAADHYSPVDLVHMTMYATQDPNVAFYIEETSEGLNYLIALPWENWHRVTWEFDNSFLLRFFQILLIVGAIIFTLMGYLFSRRIAKPVTDIIAGVEELADGQYETGIQEKGLYQSVFASLNQLGSRLRASEVEQAKTKEQREKWLSNLSHDLKTPLSTIKGYSELLADEEYPFSAAERLDYAKKIHEKSVYMEGLIEELRLNEKLKHDGIQLKKETSNLTSFIRELLIDILNHPDFTARQILFEPASEEIFYTFDADLLKRALENLLYNALLHNDEKTTVKVTLEKTKDHIAMDIIDDGQGMSAEELEQLFQRYYRGSNTKNPQGTGLGMSIAKEVIEAHQGEIMVYSEMKKGTRISIRL